MKLKNDYSDDDKADALPDNTASLINRQNLSIQILALSGEHYRAGLEARSQRTWVTLRQWPATTDSDMLVKPPAKLLA